MQTCCVSCKKNTENKDPKVIKTKNGISQTKSQCSICGNKKSREKERRRREKGNFIIFRYQNSFIKNTWVKYFVLIHLNYKKEQS